MRNGVQFLVDSRKGRRRKEDSHVQELSWVFLRRKHLKRSSGRSVRCIFSTLRELPSNIKNIFLEPDISDPKLLQEN